MERVMEVVEKKVAVMACNGLDQILGTIARMAAYKVLDELRTESTVLLKTTSVGVVSHDR